MPIGKIRIAECRHLGTPFEEEGLYAPLLDDRHCHPTALKLA